MSQSVGRLEEVSVLEVCCDEKRNYGRDGRETSDPMTDNLW